MLFLTVERPRRSPQTSRASTLRLQWLSGVHRLVLGFFSEWRRDLACPLNLRRPVPFGQPAGSSGGLSLFHRRLRRGNSNLSPEISHASGCRVDWRAFHFFYHGNLSMVIDKFVRPSIGRLVNDGLIDSFFFIRYILGGPHIRLRVHPCKGCSAETAQRLTADAKEFLDISSVQPLDEDLIRRQNQALLAESPEESDDTIYETTPSMNFRSSRRPNVMAVGISSRARSIFLSRATRPFILLPFTSQSHGPGSSQLLCGCSSGKPLVWRIEKKNLTSFWLEGRVLLFRVIRSYLELMMRSTAAGYLSILAKARDRDSCDDQHFCWFVEASRRLSNELRRPTMSCGGASG